MAMKDEDYRLSMRVSPRGKIDSAELRQLLINRLSDTDKAVLRRSLRKNNLGAYCEFCERWTARDLDDVPDVFQCSGCERRFRIELVVYEEIE